MTFCFLSSWCFSEALLTAWAFLYSPLETVRVGVFEKEKKCLLSFIHFRGSLLNRVNNLSVFLRAMMMKSANGRLQFINELWSVWYWDLRHRGISWNVDCFLKLKLHLILFSTPPPNAHTNVFKLRKDVVSDFDFSNINQLLFSKSLSTFFNLMSLN